MLTDEIKQELRDRLAAIAKSMPNFSSRLGQRTMIAEIAKAFGRSPTGKPDPENPVANTGASFVCVNGGTGIGKSLAYILVGAIMAPHKGKKLVISSSTVALQEQLVHKDLPAFLQAAGLPLRFELVKGRTRFVCEYKLRRAIEDMRQIQMFEHAPVSQSQDQIRAQIATLYEGLLERYEARDWNGERDSLDNMTDDLWMPITADRHGCLSRLCPNFRTCAQMLARQRLKDADIVVANHDMVLSDLANGNKILPAPEESLYVFDEAHHLPEKAVDAFASGHLLDSSRRMLERFDSITPMLGRVLRGENAAVPGRLAAAAHAVGAGLAEMFHFLEGLAQLKPTKEKPNPRLEFEHSLIPDDCISIGENLLASCNSLVDNLGVALDGITTLMAEDKSVSALCEKLLTDLGEYGGRIESVVDTWRLFLEERNPDQPPIAKWVEYVPPRKNVPGQAGDFQVCASPVIASGYLKAMLWARVAGAALCSATITTLGSFSYFLNRTGLRHFPDTSCVDLPSPFDYATQGILLIPPMKANPKNTELHTSEVLSTVIAEMRDLQDEGMLVLFTAKRQMNAVAEQLPPDLREKVFVQGDASKTHIIREHCARIDRGESSVIFGLESFSEGVDLAGRYCTVLIITKLPFQTPDDPVLHTLSNWIDRRGGNAFMEVSVPGAARKLEQRVGRLIRSETDSGRVLVLDTRLWTTQFGRSMLRGLPPFKVVALGKEVQP